MPCFPPFVNLGRQHLTGGGQRSIYEMFVKQQNVAAMSTREKPLRKLILYGAQFECCVATEAGRGGPQETLAG